MSVLPDVTELRAVADRISAHAVAARHRAATLEHAIAVTGWTGIAAEVFRRQAHGACDGLRNAAARLDRAADALRRHAARVDVLFADMIRLGADSLHLVEDIARLRPERVLPDALHLLGDGADLAGDLASTTVDAVGDGLGAVHDAMHDLAGGALGLVGF